MMDPQNDLEEALIQAANDPSSRPMFYKKLLAAKIFVLGFSDSPGEGLRTVAEGEKLSLVNWEKNDGTAVIPFFTSLSALQKTLDEEASFVSLAARDFFEMTRGSTLYLNPKLDYGKEFFPHEIEALLETGINHSLTQRVVQEATRILLGQPAEYPARMVSALTSLLSKHSNIKAAYLCMMHEEGTDKLPTLLVGFEGEGDLASAMKEAGSVVADTAPPGKPVDFIEVSRGDSGAASYMYESVEPFYQRKWGARLRNMLRPGRA
ncbi:enhanced serine sensitivity protein SseB [Marinobacter nanhaiticus]|nr:enhanced serine sensitivity protein SseB [Marinobacter nanhaiticus]